MPPLNRRQMLGHTGTLAAAALLAPHRAAGAPQAKVQSLTVISKPSQGYCGWSTLARRRNGQLVLVYSGGREAHVCPFGRVEMMRSSDGGTTWTWPQVLLDSATDDRDAGIVETAQGSLLVTTFTSLDFAPILAQAEARRPNDPQAWPREKLERWRAARDRLDAEQRRQDLGVWMLRSTDGGATWSRRADCLVNSPHGPVAVSGGRLIHAGKELWKDPPRNGVCESTDDGQTWKWLAEIPTRSGDRPRDYHELHAVETAKGQLIVHIRNHNKANEHETLQTESADGGKTWSVPHSIGVWGYPSHLLRLQDGRLLMSYGHRRQPLGNQARLSENDGKTWSEPLIISGDGVSVDLGYPSTVQLEDGTLVTVWYEVMKNAPLAVLRQARWQIQ